MTKREDIIKGQIKKKEREVDELKEYLEQEDTIEGKTLTQIVIDRLTNEISELNRELGTPLTKERLLQLIDESLDHRDEEEFMRLTNLLKDIK